MPFCFTALNFGFFAFFGISTQTTLFYRIIAFYGKLRKIWQCANNKLLFQIIHKPLSKNSRGGSRHCKKSLQTFYFSSNRHKNPHRREQVSSQTVKHYPTRCHKSHRVFANPHKQTPDLLLIAGVFNRIFIFFN